MQNEKFIFLPDKLILIQGLRVGAVSYSDLNIRFGATRFIESEAVPRDTQVIDRTWQYVNKSGTPDGRFRNNMQYPVCLYGTLELSSASGLHTQLMFSHPVN